MKIIKWFLKLFKKKKIEYLIPNIDNSFQNDLYKKLDDICINHHGSLPYEPD